MQLLSDFIRKISLAWQLSVFYTSVSRSVYAARSGQYTHRQLDIDISDASLRLLRENTHLLKSKIPRISKLTQNKMRIKAILNGFLH